MKKIALAVVAVALVISAGIILAALLSIDLMLWLFLVLAFLYLVALAVLVLQKINQLKLTNEKLHKATKLLVQRVEESERRQLGELVIIRHNQEKPVQ